MSEPTEARRELRLALALCVVGGGLAVWSSSQVWSAYRPAHPTLGETGASSTGTALFPAVAAMAYVGLAGALALVAARGLLRRLVGALVAAGGAVVVVEAVRAWRDTPLPQALTARPGLSVVRDADLHAGTGWMLLAVLAGLALVVAGALAALRGGGWTGLGSSYDAPGAPPAPPVTDKAVWDALDRGDDPTA